MFSSSLLNISAGCSSPTVVHNHHHQLLQESVFSELFSDHDSSISGGLFHSPNPPVAGTIMNTAPSFEKNVMDLDMVPASVADVSKKKSDKRSKIRTAQGLRDRRVRMSIGIARKFFDLQDLLGFDKPSRTLEWLLKSSNKAILELSAASSSSISCKETAANATRTGDDYKSLSSSRSTDEAERLSCNSAALQTMKQKATSLARESRDKARARARARTVAKLSAAKLNHQKIQLLSTYPDERRGDQNSYLSKNEYNFSSPSLVKSLVAESHNEEQHKQNQKLQLHTYYSGIKSYYQSDLNPNLSVNQWDISSVFPQPSSSTAHQLNFPRVKISTPLVDPAGIAYSTITKLYNGAYYGNVRHLLSNKGKVCIGILRTRHPSYKLLPYNWKWFALKYTVVACGSKKQCF